MKKCSNCKVIVMDDTSICPLCRQVLETDGTPALELGESVYPDAIRTSQRKRLVSNIILFASIVVETALVGLCLLPGIGLIWAILAGLVLVYVNVFLRLSILGKSGYMFKVMSGLIFSILFLYGLDDLTGFRGWSLELAFPIGVLALDLAIGILMIVNHRNWQSYMCAQLGAILLSLIPLILLLLGLIRYPYFVWAAFTVSVLFFLGTLIIGDYRARTELKRRFHI